jgi:hypothetical protein
MQDTGWCSTQRDLGGPTAPGYNTDFSHFRVFSKDWRFLMNIIPF